LNKMRKRVLGHIAVLITAVISLSSNIAIADKGGISREVDRKRHQNTIIRILDGDTFVLSDNTRIRLIGVDTPEKGEPYADIARNFADSVLLGKTVVIEYDKLRFDRYDRILGYLFFDSIFFNELIIRRGLAHVYLFKENKRFSERLIGAQKEARQAKLGIWSSPKPSDEPYYISAGGSFRFHRPLCPLIKKVNLRKARKYDNRDSALDDGLSPCRECRP